MRSEREKELLQGLDRQMEELELNARNESTVSPRCVGVAFAAFSPAVAVETGAGDVASVNPSDLEDEVTDHLETWESLPPEEFAKRWKDLATDPYVGVGPDWVGLVDDAIVAQWMESEDRREADPPSPLAARGHALEPPDHPPEPGPNPRHVPGRGGVHERQDHGREHLRGALPDVGGLEDRRGFEGHPARGATATVTSGVAVAERPPAKSYREGTHRVVPPETTWRRVRDLLPRAGITRVADVTRLDGLGIPTFQAVRPGSLNLSVSQGKGATAIAARVSAVMESLEMWHAEDLGHLPRVVLSAPEMA